MIKIAFFDIDGTLVGFKTHRVAASSWRAIEPQKTARRRAPIHSDGMLMIKIAFFDIDGTLVGFKTHRVAASSWRAIELMRERGIKVVIASGRSMAEMHEELKGKFDAYVTMNGQLCFDARGLRDHERAAVLRCAGGVPRRAHR